MNKIAQSGRKILFVATKKQAKDIVSEMAKKVKMPYITERWPGGMLTNFVTIRKAVKKMTSIDRMKKDGTFETLSKKEKLQVDRLREKLDKNLGSISEMTRLPGAVFIVDIKREHIAIKEAQKLKILCYVYRMKGINNLNNNTAIITGGSKGIGKDIVKKFINSNCNVAFTYISSDEEAEKIEKEFGRNNLKIKKYISDASNFEASSKLVEDVIKDFGGFDILINLSLIHI